MRRPNSMSKRLRSQSRERIAVVSAAIDCRCRERRGGGAVAVADPGAVERGVWLWEEGEEEVIVTVLSIRHRGGVDCRNFLGDRRPAVLALSGCDCHRHSLRVAAAPSPEA